MANSEPNELIIVRRRRDAMLDEHHGGVWKIAYADFMTAMMAFFLVMWLVTASDEATRAAMVSYFNPIRLVDSADKPKGLKDPEDNALPSTSDTGVDAGRPAGEGGLELQGPETGGGEEKVAPRTEVNPVDAPTGAGDAAKVSEGEKRSITGARDAEAARYSDRELFENPYAILAALASEAEAIMQTDGSPGTGGQGSLQMAKTPVLFAQPNRDPDGEGLADGTSFRDPFDPSGWQEEPLPGNAPLLANIPLLERDEEGIAARDLTPEQIKVLQEAVRLSREGKKIPGVELTGDSKLRTALMMIRSKAMDAAGQEAGSNELEPMSEEMQELAMVLAITEAQKQAREEAQELSMLGAVTEPVVAPEADDTQDLADKAMAALEKPDTSSDTEKLAAIKQVGDSDKPFQDVLSVGDKIVTGNSEEQGVNTLEGTSAFAGTGPKFGLGKYDGVDVATSFEEGTTNTPPSPMNLMDPVLESAAAARPAKGNTKNLVRTAAGKGEDANVKAVISIDGDGTGVKQLEPSLGTAQRQPEMASLPLDLTAQPQKQKPSDGEVLAQNDANVRLANANEQRFEKISQKVGEALNGYGAGASVELTQNSDGVLIRLMDNDKFGMFAIGSAEPKGSVVKAMEEIAKVLNEQEGEIVIRGHTDGRPFRSATNDNWRLSMSRAHMAYYMLVRGGLDKKRIVGIEGYADRRLKNDGDPYAPENRRIEIVLLKEET